LASDEAWNYYVITVFKESGMTRKALNITKFMIKFRKLVTLVIFLKNINLTAIDLLNKSICL